MNTYTSKVHAVLTDVGGPMEYKNLINECAERFELDYDLFYKNASRKMKMDPTFVSIRRGVWGLTGRDDSFTEVITTDAEKPGTTFTDQENARFDFQMEFENVLKQVKPELEGVSAIELIDFISNMDDFINMQEWNCWIVELADKAVETEEEERVQGLRDLPSNVAGGLYMDPVELREALENNECDLRVHGVDVSDYTDISATLLPSVIDELGTERPSDNGDDIYVVRQDTLGNAEKWQVINSTRVSRCELIPTD